MFHCNVHIIAPALYIKIPFICFRSEIDSNEIFFFYWWGWVAISFIAIYIVRLISWQFRSNDHYIYRLWRTTGIEDTEHRRQKALWAWLFRTEMAMRGAAPSSGGPGPRFSWFSRMMQMTGLNLLFNLPGGSSRVSQTKFRSLTHFLPLGYNLNMVSPPPWERLRESDQPYWRFSHGWLFYLILWEYVSGGVVSAPRDTASSASKGTCSVLAIELSVAVYISESEWVLLAISVHT